MAPPTYNVAPPLTKPSLFSSFPFLGPPLSLNYYKLIFINLLVSNQNLIFFPIKKKKNPIFLNDISLNPQSNPKSPCF